MKSIKVELPRALKSVEIHTFADFHIGDKGCDMAHIKEMIEYVRVTENAYCILNGDIVNNATKTSVSDSYAEQLSPMEELELFVDLFAPIKNKIIAITQGNHEKRTYNKEGIDITELVARQLGLEDRYSKTGILVFLKVGELKCGLKNAKGEPRQVAYMLYCNHGSGGGRKEGAKAIRLADMACIVDADIYIHSHTHLPMIMKQAYYRSNSNMSSVAIVDKLFINTSAQLNYGGYGEQFEFKPSSKDTPVIYLDGTKKRMEAKL